MTNPATLENHATRALRALDEEDFPQLKQDLRDVLYKEQTAAASHQFNLAIDMGGADFNVYFDVEAGDDIDEWVVSPGLQAFYQGIEITELFEGSDLDKQIYARSNEVQDMIDDAWAEAKIDQYEMSRDD